MVVRRDPSCRPAGTRFRNGGAAGILALLLLPASAPGAEDEPAPAGPAVRLADALVLKEKREVEEAMAQLELLARSGGAGASKQREDSTLTAAGVLAELEAIDARIRLSKLEGLEPRLERLLADSGGNQHVIRRARALNTLLRLRGGLLPEPNAIARVDLGDRFLARFFPARTQPPQVPLDLPLRHLSDLTPGGAPSSPRGGRLRSIVVAGFLDLDDLAAARRASWRPALEWFEQDPRALVALFIYTGDAELPLVSTAEEPWSRAAVFWIRGTRAQLINAPVRTRYEWLPGPTFFLLETRGKILSWRWPHEGWDGFLKDAVAALAGRPAAAAKEER